MLLRTLGETTTLGINANDTNLYRYVGNDATNSVDPTGLKIVIVGRRPGLDTPDIRKIINDLKKRDDIAGCLARWADKSGVTVRIDFRDPSDEVFNKPHGERKEHGGDDDKNDYGQIFLPQSPDLLPTNYDKKSGDVENLSDEQTAQVVLVHELGHAVIGLSDPDNVALVENPFRKSIGAPPRDDYDGVQVPDAGAVSPQNQQAMANWFDQYNAWQNKAATPFKPKK